MTDNKALITGVTGFKGSHLADFLIDVQEVEVHGIRRPRSRDEFVRDDVVYHEGDITDPTAMASIVRDVQPTWLWHLAAQSFVPLSWQAPQATIQQNVMGTVNVLEAVRRESPDTITVVAGSSEEYGMVLPDELPVDESNALRPLSPYGVSKVCSDLLAQQYHRSYDMRTVVTRAFNTTGPRRGEPFVTSNFAKQIVDIEAGRRDRIIRHGNLAAQRDFTDVRDMTRAYWLVANIGRFGDVFNMCSGQGRTIQEVLDTLLSFSDAEIVCEVDPARMRPSDVPLLLGDASKLHVATGWQPEYPFERTMEDLLNYWRERVK